MVHQEYGTLPWSRVLQPAIQLAAEGFSLGSYQARMAQYMRSRLPASRFPETARIQFPTDDTLVEPGTRLVQKDLAATLSAIATKGPSVFYTGDLAVKMADEVGHVITGDKPAEVVPLRKGGAS